jgi:CRISPR system Cascade subunit CasC
MKKFVEIHVLQNFAPSNLNRDDTGAPKDAIFGGVRRARISSQCLKRSVREYFKENNAEFVAKRTKRILENLKETLVPKLNGKKGYSDENLDKAIESAINCIGVKDKKVKVGKDKKTDVLLFLSPKEILDFASTIEETFGDLLKAKVSEEVAKRLSDCIDGENKGRLSLDVALFGRMLAVMPEKSQDAACQVAHALSTHAVDREFDFYTAVDDLKPGDTSGADMIGTVEFNSACFYRYAVVDWDKLSKNLQGDTEQAKKGMRAFLEGFVVAEPTGKQNTFAAHNPPEFVVVKVRKDGAPRNVANAFEVPVRNRKDQSLVGESANKLVEKDKALQSAYGGDGKTFVLNLTGAKLEGYATEVKTLQELLDKAMASVEA